MRPQTPSDLAGSALAVELDHPAWHALRGPHASLAHVSAGGLAVRYPANASPFAAVAAPEPDAFAELGTLMSPGETVALVMADPVVPPPPWRVVRSMPGLQMVGGGEGHSTVAAPPLLTRADVSDMLALTELTKPGPFLPETITMGHYVGFRSPAGRLVAMAGERLRLPTAVEISAVCTDPDHRGRGYASALVAYLARRIAAGGRVPVLHLRADNPARSVYEKAGFSVRRTIHITVVAAD